MTPLRIEVSGSSQIFHPAERCVVSIKVQSEGPSQDEVFKNVSGASAQVRQLLTSLSGTDEKGQSLPNAAVTHWSNSALSTGSYQSYGASSFSGSSKHGSKAKTQVHTANTTFEAKFQNFAKLGSVAMTLSTMKFVSITNVSWRLTDRTKAELSGKSRQMAVRDAITKAKGFAQALDRSSPPVTEIRDSAYGGGSNYPAGARVAAYTSSSPAGEDFNFTPEDVAIECRVIVICEDKL